MEKEVMNSVHSSVRSPFYTFSRRLYRALLPVLCVGLLVFVGCNKDKAKLANLGIESVYFTERMKPVIVDCDLQDGTSYVWTLRSVETEGHGVQSVNIRVGDASRLVVVHDSVGKYSYQLEYRDAENLVVEKFLVVVENELTAYDANASRVLDYRPAPGMKVNKYPFISDKVRTQDEANAACARWLMSGKPITLGGFGGYIVFGFDHMVVNLPDAAPDFAVLCPKDARSRPGVVMVAYDENGNGLADDTWYELIGESHGGAKRSVRVTYNRPVRRWYEAGPSAAPEDKAKKFLYPDHVKATLSDGSAFSVPYVGDAVLEDDKKDDFFAYWPKWLKQEGKLEFEATLLPNVCTETPQYSTTSLTHYKREYSSLGLGYVGNPQQEECIFCLENAVDAQGNFVTLPGVHFIKICTGVNQQISEEGSLSTEITGVKDLNVKVAGK